MKGANLKNYKFQKSISPKLSAKSWCKLKGIFVFDWGLLPVWFSSNLTCVVLLNLKFLKPTKSKSNIRRTFCEISSNLWYRQEQHKVILSWRPMLQQVRNTRKHARDVLLVTFTSKICTTNQLIKVQLYFEIFVICLN